MKILVIAKQYPSQERPWEGIFIHELMRELYLLGAEPCVLAPESLSILAKFNRGGNLAKTREKYDKITIHRPRYLSYSNKRFPFGLSTYRWTIDSFSKVTLKLGLRLNEAFDLCYGHFLYPSGKATLLLAERLGIPAVVALGESSFEHYETHFGLETVCEDMKGFACIVAVSDSIKERCVSRYGIPEERIRVFPNGIDTEKFYPRDKKEMRKRFNFPLDKPIVAFVGHLNERKGPLRLLAAIKSHPEIKAFFLGNGDRIPKGSQVLFQGTVPHKEIPKWLSAADIFVLPTLHEGCCNAILEALACGLPVISSDRPFNHVVLDDSVSILVDPMDLGAIRKAVLTLINNPEQRLRMSESARQRALKFSITERARGILDCLTLTIREEHNIY